VALELPELVRGACLAEIAPGGLLLLTGFFAALGGGVWLRFLYDRRDPVPVGDPKEKPRLLLQWGLTISLAVPLVLVLQGLAGGWLVPPAAGMGPWLRLVLGVDGLGITARYGARLWAVLRREPPQKTSIIPELDARPPVTKDDGSVPAPMAPLEAAVPDAPAVRLRRELGALAIGLAMLWAGLHGWKMESLCYLRLPER